MNENHQPTVDPESRVERLTRLLRRAERVINTAETSTLSLAAGDDSRVADAWSVRHGVTVFRAGLQPWLDEVKELINEGSQS